MSECAKCGDEYYGHRCFTCAATTESPSINRWRLSDHRSKRELAFAATWLSDTYGEDTLRQILTPGVRGSIFVNACDADGNLVPTATISERDRVVAATVIQWLGTHVGRGFLDATRRRPKLISPKDELM